MCGSTSVTISYSVSVYDRERECVARRTPHSSTHLAFSHSESIHDRKRERGSCSKSLAFDGEKTTALVTSQATSSSPCVFLHPSPAVSSFDSATSFLFHLRSQLPMKSIGSTNEGGSGSGLVVVIVSGHDRITQAPIVLLQLGGYTVGAGVAAVVIRMWRRNDVFRRLCWFL